MKRRLFKITSIVFIALGLLTYSCADLVVENLVEPDSSKALANPSDLMNLAGGAFRTFHNAMQEYDGPALAMVTMADQGTCSWGNAAMNDLSSEPRAGYVNNLTYPYFPVVEHPWGETYAAISAVNDVLRAIEEKGVEIGDDGEDTKMTQAWSYFVSGAAHGYLGLIFDQGNIIKWDTDLETLTLSPWQDLISASLEMLDQAIALCAANTFTVPENWMAGDVYTSAELGALASSYAARILAYSSRNKAQNEAIDWSKVLAYAQNGIEKPLSPMLGINYDWYDYYMVYQIYPGWGRTDHRIINIMDNDYPSRWPNDNATWNTADGLDPGEATSDDARLLSDYEYMADQAFRPERGFYHFSHYRFQRYDWLIAEHWYGTGNKPSFLVWENEMLEAEALVRTGNVAGAVAILNDPDGARKLRGGLPDVTATDAAKVLLRIYDEKDVECMDTGVGVGFFDMRRNDRLQSGTILHFPVPATELEIIQEPVYTIGGAPDGENVSMGSWTGYDGLTSPPK